MGRELNGQLSGIREDITEIKGRVGKVENHLDIIDGDLKGVKKQVGHVYTVMADRGLI